MAARELFLEASLPMLLGTIAALGWMRKVARGPMRIARPPQVSGG